MQFFRPLTHSVIDQRGKATVLVSSLRNLKLHLQCTDLNRHNSINSQRDEGTREGKLGKKGEEKVHLHRAEGGSSYDEG